MSILKLTKTLPDGRIVSFHAPTEFRLDVTTNHMQIIVESYDTELAARNRGASSAKSVVDVQLQDWNPEYANNLLNFVLADAAWSDAIVLP